MVNCEMKPPTFLNEPNSVLGSEKDKRSAGVLEYLDPEPRHAIPLPHHSIAPSLHSAPPPHAPISRISDVILQILQDLPTMRGLQIKL
jgi:hypothetical protein